MATHELAQSIKQLFMTLFYRSWVHLYACVYVCMCVFLFPHPRTFFSLLLQRERKGEIGVERERDSQRQGGVREEH